MEASYFKEDHFNQGFDHWNPPKEKRPICEDSFNSSLNEQLQTLDKTTRTIAEDLRKELQDAIQKYNAALAVQDNALAQLESLPNSPAKRARATAMRGLEKAQQMVEAASTEIIRKERQFVHLAYGAGQLGIQDSSPCRRPL